MSVPNPATTQWVPLQGKVPVTYLGQWESGRTYYDGDAVIAANGVLYVCCADGTTTAPETWPGAGQVGPQGPIGAQGPQGVGVPLPVVNGSWIKGVGGAAVWAPILETDVRGLVVADTAWHWVGDPGEPAYQNSWRWYGTNEPTYGGARFRKLANGMVVCAGLIDSGAAGSTAFTLPVGYRPDLNKVGGAADYIFPNAAASAYQEGIRLNSNGELRPQVTGVSGWVSLSQVIFYAR